MCFAECDSGRKYKRIKIKPGAIHSRSEDRKSQNERERLKVLAFGSIKSARFHTQIDNGPFPLSPISSAAPRTMETDCSKLTKRKVTHLALSHAFTFPNSSLQLLRIARMSAVSIPCRYILDDLCGWHSVIGAVRARQSTCPHTN